MALNRMVDIEKEAYVSNRMQIALDVRGYVTIEDMEYFGKRWDRLHETEKANEQIRQEASDALDAMRNPDLDVNYHAIRQALRFGLLDYRNFMKCTEAQRQSGSKRTRLIFLRPRKLSE